jgi:uncharacterized protein YaeQ
MAPFNKFAVEGDVIGRLLAGYTNIEISLLHCVQVATGDLNAVLRRMFGERGETKRINAAVKLGLPEYQRLKLAADFEKSIRVVRHCLKIRNQYAHWVWWDDYSGKLAFANVEDLTKYRRPIRDLGKLKAHHVDAVLLKAQEAYFVYADDLLSWVNYEGRFRDKKLGAARQNPLGRPIVVKKPKLRLP